jgi:hypothetical protein
VDVTAKRDGAYFLDRIESENPVVFADYLAGKYQSINEAARAAGLKRPRTRLHELKNGWQKATRSEKLAFLAWARVTPGGAPAVAPAPPPCAVDGYVEPWAKARVSHLMAVRKLKMGGVMAEMGLSQSDGSLGMAKARSTKIAPRVVLALKKWLSVNSAI